MHGSVIYRHVFVVHFYARDYNLPYFGGKVVLLLRWPDVD